MFDIHVLTNFQDTINQKANCQVLPTINSKKKTHEGTLHGVSVSLRSGATATIKTYVH